MIKTTLTIKHALGLHARASMQLVDCVSRFSSTVIISCGKKSCDAKNILDVMTLGATRGMQITVKVDGDDELETMAAVENFFNKGEDEPF
jgi:phosphotransferase system HPr (HPr) family protein